jgi:transcription elongation factor GreA
MSQELITKIEQMLHEEKWTRTAIGAYTVSLIKELDVLLVQVIQNGIQDEIKELCDNHLAEAKNSIVALYLSGMISLERQMLDDTHLVKLVSLFAQNIKWPLVEHIALQILVYGENKFALRSLIDCYKNEANEEKLHEAEERLIKVDIEEADIVYSLAQRYEKEKNLEKAVDYYKKGIHRFIHKKNFNRIREIWLKLIEFCPEETDYFTQVESKVAKLLGAEKACQLLEDLYPLFVQNKKWDEAIAAQLKINEYEPKSGQVRREIISCLKQKHAATPKTEEYLRLSNLGDSWKSVVDALEDFKKQMAYEKGNFVFHKAWGVGRIREVKEQEYIIDFETKRNQSMGQKMAVEALLSLSRDDIRVIIATTKREELAKRIKSEAEIDWALKTIIKSFGNKADMKMIKAILVPKVLEEREWTTWSTKARNRIKESPDFTLSPDKQDEFMVRTQPISKEEKIYNKFRAEKDFFKRYDILEEFLEHGNRESDYFGELFASFASYLKGTKVNEEVIASFLIIQKYSKAFPFINPGHNKSFLEYFQQIDELEPLFRNLNSAKLRTAFLQQIKLHVATWDVLFVKLFPLSLSVHIIDDLIAAEKTELVQKLFEDLMERHKDHKEAFFHAAKMTLDGRVPFTARLTQEKILITLVHDLDLSFRDISNKKDVTDAKRINKTLANALFKDGILDQYLRIAPEDSVRRLFSLIHDVRDLNPNLKVEVRAIVGARFPHLVAASEPQPVAVSSRKGLLATLKMFNAKKKELQQILDVEVPKNAKEIGTAMAMGDLKENAEYHAAKEHQTMLSATVGTLNKEIDSATVIEKTDVDPTKVGFGTVVTLISNADEKIETYTILGPWESDPVNNVISYLSPFGDKLLGARVGDTLKFTINERKCDYHVKKIAVADF